MKQIAIALVDSWSIFREGISLMLKEAGCEVVIEAQDIGDLIRQLGSNVTFPPIFMVNAGLLIEGDGAIEKLRLGWPNTKIVAYDPNEDQPSKLQIKNSGVDKYISKDEDFEHTIKNWLLENRVNLISS